MFKTENSRDPETRRKRIPVVYFLLPLLIFCLVTPFASAQRFGDVLKKVGDGIKDAGEQLKKADTKVDSEDTTKSSQESTSSTTEPVKAKTNVLAGGKVDKSKAAEDWKTLSELHDQYTHYGDSLSSDEYLCEMGETRLAEWNEWKAEFVPFWERFVATYGESYDELEKSFEGVQQPLGVTSDVHQLTNIMMYAADTDKQEQRYLDALLRKGRDSYLRWTQMENPEPTKMELKFDYTDRALTSFRLAKKLDPDGDYDQYIKQAQDAYDETKPIWIESLKKIEWPGHKSSFSGPGSAGQLASAAIAFLKEVERWTKPEYDDVHKPIAACVTGSGWEVSKKNALGQPLQYSINITVAFEGEKDPDLAYVYDMVFYTAEELGVKKGLPFRYCNSRQYQKYRMLKSKVPK